VRLRLEEVRAVTPDVSPAAEDLDAGMREVDRLSGIVDDLLTLSRAGRPGTAAEEVDVLAAARAAAERFRAHAADQGARVEVHGGRTVARVSPTALEHVLDVLIENAVAYSPPGGLIELEVGEGRLAVMDHGPGLEEGEEEAVFARFHRGSAARTGTPGTGLGLAIARQLAREWGGEVTLANRLGGGARAVVVLPGDRSPAAPVHGVSA
jgi:two-component system sensor histidine kinase MprB